MLVDFTGSDCHLLRCGAVVLWHIFNCVIECNDHSDENGNANFNDNSGGNVLFEQLVEHNRNANCLHNRQSL